MNPGVGYALFAFGTWGLVPLYFALLSAVPALEVVLHRALGSLLFLLLVLAWMGRWGWLKDVVRAPRQLAMLALSATLIAANWGVYVHAVQTGQVLQSSLGYFINPLVNVALGVLVLRERLRPAQWLAVAVAVAGVGWLTWDAGEPPWIALALAGLFGVYGLVRKTAPLGALEGLTAETMLLAPVALAALLWLGSGLGPGGWTWGLGSVSLDAATWGWLALSGPLTALPLLAFAAAARRLTLATLGVIQYLSPSMQFVLGLTVFGEAFDAGRAVGFALIWVALAIYSAEAVWSARRAGSAAGAAAAGTAAGVATSAGPDERMR